MNDFEATLFYLKKCTRNGNCLEAKTYRVQKYPYIKIGRKTIKASRLLLSLWTQRTEPKLCALHTCDNKKCINPAHLYWGNKSQNALDSVERGQHFQATKTHCKRGHPLSGKNLYFNKNNKTRHCRACNKLLGTTVKTQRSGE